MTLVTYQREELFGEVIDGGMRLNEVGKIMQDEWLRTAIVRPFVDVDEFMIMPNHLHGILIVNERDDATVGATRRVAPTAPTIDPGSLGAIIGQIKSITAKHINSYRNTPGQHVWQRNYYEHIIRDESELARIRNYILENPSRWDSDEENPRINR